jgi:hypothetical protein
MHECFYITAKGTLTFFHDHLLHHTHTHTHTHTGLEMDVTNLTFADGSFDVVIDKGTMDALLVNQRVPLFHTVTSLQHLLIVASSINVIICL